MSERWEKAIQEWYDKSQTANLEYLDLSSESTNCSKIAHNLAVIHDRLNLFSRVHIKNNKRILEDLERITVRVTKLEKGVVNLTQTFLDHKPLSQEEVRSLTKEITHQPKLVEEEVLRLTGDLNQKLEWVEEILHKVEHWLNT